MNVVNWVVENWQTVLAIFGGMVAVASTIVHLTPSQKDDAILAKVVKVLDFLSTVNPKPPKQG
jgi:hypothetical protein